MNTSPFVSPTSRGAAVEQVDSPQTRWLRVEGFAALTVSVMAYAHHDGEWLLFAVLFLAPDLSMLGYLGGARAGAIAYNGFHTYTLPFLLLGAAIGVGHELYGAVALIWVAHIGLDRALGYGLKSPEGFHATHLGRIGRGESRLSESRPGSRR